MSPGFRPQPLAIAGAVLAALLAAFGTAANAQVTTPSTAPKTAPAAPGYVGDSQRQAVVNPFGLCWHSGSWTPAQAADPCDAVPRVAVAVPPPPPPAAAPAPAPLAVAPAPRPPIIEKLTLSSDVLFDFDKATLKDAGKQKLDELADRIKDARVEEITTVGHADRIASDQYNQKLSEQRAQSVKEYLASKGVPTERIKAEGKGEAQPVTGDACKHMGPEKGSNRKLVSCLQPDRRVEIEVAGSRQVATGTAPGAAGGGATTPPAASSPSSGSGTTSPK